MDGRDSSALKVERCASGPLSIDVVAIDDQAWFTVESLTQLGGDVARLEAAVPKSDRASRVVLQADGVKQPVSLLNELGLYRVLLASENPTAADLVRWVFDEVAPAIRKSGRFRLFQEAKRLGVRLDFTDDQWEWLKLRPHIIDVIPLALAGFDSVQISQMLAYNTPSGITVRKQLAVLRRLGFIPLKIPTREKQLEARIVQSLKT